MAEHIVSGGGDALNAFLKSSKYTNNDTIWVEPGIYTPVRYEKYLQGVHVRATDGKENTIIDGLGLSTCLRNNFVNSNYIFFFHDFTLRNGYVSSDLSAPTQYTGGAMHGAIRLIDSNIYDCSAVNFASNPTAGSWGFIGAAWCGSGVNGAYNCEISGCIGTKTLLIRSGNLWNCNVHHNTCTLAQAGDRFTFGVGIVRSKIHHNTLAGMGFGSSTYQSSLFYENQSSSGNSRLFERGKAKNCIIVNNRNFARIEYGNGMHSKLENCVYAGNVPSGSNKNAEIWAYSNNTAVFNCAIDMLSGQWANWINFNTTYPLSNSVSGNIWGLPLSSMGFYDPDDGDFRLKKDSPLIGTGCDAYYAKQLSGEGGFTNANAKLDHIGLRWKDPPSIGIYEYYGKKQNLPNKMYPMGKESKLLPYDTEIEYLQSSGTQWIDTNFTNDSGYIEVDLTMFNGGNGNYPMAFGKTLGTQSPYYPYRTILYRNGANSTRMIYENGYSSTNYDGAWPKIFSISKSQWKTQPLDSQYANSVSLAIFASNGITVSGSACSLVQLRKFKLWNDSNMLVRDFVPVRVGTIGYLYDRVSGTLFGNSGTGNFILGPDK